MLRTTLAFVLLMTPASLAKETRYLLRGEIDESTSLFPPLEPGGIWTWETYGQPPGGYPIEYAARLNTSAEDDWSMSFQVTSLDRTETFQLGSATGPSLSFTPESLEISQIEYFDFLEFFDLSLNLDSGIGTWFWQVDCPECDLQYPLPSANARIDSYEIVNGDFDGRGSWDVNDIDFLMAKIIHDDHDPRFDLTADGFVDNSDRDEWLAIAGPRNGFAGPYLHGDADLDGTVNVNDLGPVGLNWNTERNNWTDGNFTGIGIDTADLNLLALNWNMSVPRAAAVPEPVCSTLTMAMICAFWWHYGFKSSMLTLNSTTATKNQ